MQQLTLLHLGYPKESPIPRPDLLHFISLKQFNVLTTHFRHMSPRDNMMEKHGKCFNAVAVIAQLKFVHGMKTFGKVDHDVVHW